MKIFLSFILILLLISCTDDSTKLEPDQQKVRIEFSKCIGCFECIDNFDCPHDAILIDANSDSTTVIIDQDKCTLCMKCIDQFTCPKNAITNEQDNVSPSEIEQFTAYSDSIGLLKIEFIAPGDDDTLGLCYTYKFELSDSLDNFLFTDFEVPRPKAAGIPESWEITGLPENNVVKVKLQAFDEANNASQQVNRNVNISGIEIDDTKPGTITDLIAESFEDKIRLAWTATGDDGLQGTAIKYEIRYSTVMIDESNWFESTIFSNEIIPANVGEQEELIIYDFPVQTEYFFAIIAIDEVDNFSDTSNSVSAMITGDVTPPANISDLEISSVSMNSFVLRWTAVGDNDLSGFSSFYVIKIHDSEINDNNWDDLTEIEQNMTPLESGNEEMFVIQNLEPLSTYFVAIKAIDEADNSSPLSNIVETETLEELDEIAPSQITDLEAIGFRNGFNLTWTAVGDDFLEGIAFEYILKMSTSIISEENWDSATTIENVPLPSPSGELETLTITDFEPGLQYYFGIKAIDDESNASPLSNIAESVIPQDDISPATINDLLAETVVNDAILTWTAPGDDNDEGTATFYEIRTSDFEITESNWESAILLDNPPIPQIAGSIETYTFENMEGNTDYYFAIKVFDELENSSGISNNAFAYYVSDTNNPGQITDLTVVEGNAINMTTIKIQWTATGDDDNSGTAHHYEIRYSQYTITDLNWELAPIFNNPPQPSAPNTAEECNITGLQAGTKYYFAIKAFDEQNNASDLSNSPAGKIVYLINTGACHNCNSCINDCDYGAIHQGPGYKFIEPDECQACGDCSCPWDLIHLSVFAY
ncbi:MAG: fibronectin type III domain-containing protein [Candidatus Cloacimonetes bacterium]|nr:fibronectin type III domain-containing protein [Candidatus Cloacimonadota bacterium]